MHGMSENVFQRFWKASSHLQLADRKASLSSVIPRFFYSWQIQGPYMATEFSKPAWEKMLFLPWRTSYPPRSCAAWSLLSSMGDRLTLIFFTWNKQILDSNLYRFHVDSHAYRGTSEIRHRSLHCRMSSAFASSNKSTELIDDQKTIVVENQVNTKTQHREIDCESPSLTSPGHIDKVYLWVVLMYLKAVPKTHCFISVSSNNNV